jgi:hypothetical protein
VPLCRVAHGERQRTLRPLDEGLAFVGMREVEALDVVDGGDQGDARLGELQPETACAGEHRVRVVEALVEDIVDELLARRRDRSGRERGGVHLGQGPLDPCRQVERDALTLQGHQHCSLIVTQQCRELSGRREQRDVTPPSEPLGGGSARVGHEVERAREGGLRVRGNLEDALQVELGRVARDDDAVVGQSGEEVF